MKPWEIWTTHISTFLVTVSGLAYLWMKYLMVTDDPFSVVNHPWQPAMLSLHVLVAPLLVFVVGMMAHSHIQKKLQSGSRSNRSTGVVSMFALPLMIVSGYMLQVVTAGWLLSLTLILHLLSSFIFAVTYVTHLVVSYRLARKARSLRDPGVFARKQVA